MRRWLPERFPDPEIIHKLDYLIFVFENDDDEAKFAKGIKGWYYGHRGLTDKQREALDRLYERVRHNHLGPSEPLDRLYERIRLDKP